MEQQIHITLQFDFAIGKVNLNEIVYRLDKLKNPLMMELLKTILTRYDDLIADRLSPQRGVMTPSKMRKGLGRHVRKGDPDNRFCHGRCIRKRGYRKLPRVISTVFGKTAAPHTGSGMSAMRRTIFSTVECVEDKPLQPQRKQLRA